MLTKETFLKVIDLIKKQEEIHDQITDTLGLFCDGNGLLFTGSTEYHKALMMVLIESMGDDPKDSLIEWWLYEDVEKIVCCNDKVFFLHTPEKLYDFLCNRKEE